MSDDALADTQGSELPVAIAATLTSERRRRGSGEDGFRGPTGAIRYERREEIGRGGMGVVSRAVDLQFSRDVALKEMRRELDGDGFTDRFATECIVTGNLEHPGIPAVYERGEIEGRPFYTMRRVRGQPLERALEQAGSLSERLRLVPALTRAAQTLAYAHSRGVVHRDIKPDNVVIGDFGETFVLDWGIAKVRGVSDAAGEVAIPSEGDAATRVGSIVGTPAYMAPEQAAGDVERTDERSDVFALGAILYHVLTGRAPYRGSRVDQLIEKAKRCEFESIHQAAPEAPRRLRLLCERAMAPDPRKRFRSAGELAVALEQFTTEAVAHQDAGAVGWVARTATVLSIALAVGALLFSASMVPRFPVLGIGAYPIGLFALLGCLLSVLELATVGRYRLEALIFAMMGATLLAGLLAFSSGGDHVLASALSAFDRSDEFRAALTVGAREINGVLTLTGAVTLAQVFLWAVARRRVTLRRAVG